MFENIHFKNLNLDITITQHNYKYSIIHYFGKDDLILASSEEVADWEFVIDGNAKYCIPYAVSDYAKSHLFYITQFAILNNRKNYFTRRKKMDSYLLSITYEGEGVLERHIPDPTIITAPARSAISCSPECAGSSRS